MVYFGIIYINLKSDSEFIKGLKDNFSLDLIIRKKFTIEKNLNQKMSKD